MDERPSPAQRPCQWCATDRRRYTGANIRVLEGIEAVRKRPAMYIGDTTTRGLHHLVYEVVDNSIDEAMAGYCRNIHVTIHVDGSVSVVDDGRGIPVDIHADSGKSALEVVLTKVHAGGKFDHDTYKVSGGLHGVGVTVVNALSEWLEAEVRRDGQVWQQEFEQGEPPGPVRAIGPAKATGTEITLPARRRDLPQDRVRLRHLEKRLRELAFLNKGVRIRLTDERGDEPQRRRVLLVGGPQRVRRLPESRPDGRCTRRSSSRAATRSAPLKSRSLCSTTIRSARWSSRTATTSTRSRGART